MVEISQTKNWILYSILILALVGLIDTGYLSYAALAGIDAICAPGGGCSQVLNSSYSKVGSIPLGIFGVAYYALLVILILFCFKYRNYRYASFIVILSGLGFAFSLFLTYLQFFVIHELCEYCLTSAASSTLVFFVSIFGLKRKKVVEVELNKS